MSTKVEEIVARNFVTGGFKNALALYKDDAKYDEIAYNTNDILELLIILSSFVKKAIHEIETETSSKSTDINHLKTVEEIENENNEKETIKRLDWLLKRIGRAANKMIQKDFSNDENKKLIDAIDTALKNPIDSIGLDIIDQLTEICNDAVMYSMCNK